MKISISHFWFKAFPLFAVLFFPSKVFMGLISVTDAFIVLYFFLFLIFLNYSRVITISINSFLVLFFILISLISFLVHLSGHVTEDISYLIRLFEYGLIYFITFIFYSEIEDADFVKGILWAFYALFVFGIIQIIFPKIIILGGWGPSWKETYVKYKMLRIYSLLDNPLNLAGIIVLFLGVFHYIKERQIVKLLLAYLLLILTAAKSALIITIFSFAKFLLSNFDFKNIELSKKKVVVVLFLIITISISLTISKGPTLYKRIKDNKNLQVSINQRLMVLSSSMGMIKDHFLWGIGPGTFKTYYLSSYKKPDASTAETSFTSENLFLDTYLDYGFFSFLSFILLFFNSIRIGLTTLNNKLIKGLSLSLIFFILIGMTTNLRAAPLNMMLFYFFGIISASAKTKYSKNA